MSFRKEYKEYINPLLQAPLNRLFVPRPALDYLPAIDRDEEERTYVKVLPTANYVHFLNASSPKVEEFGAEREPENKTKEHRKGEILAAKEAEAKQQLDENVRNWNPNENDAATEDAFKTLFIGRLPFAVNEAELRRTFEHYGPIKSVKIVTKKDGTPRGYAFVEFEREKDMKYAYMDADGMRFPGQVNRILVDIERGRTVKGWLPRRLGGGLGRTRGRPTEINQKHSGRDPKANDVLKELSKDAQSRDGRKRSPSRERDYDPKRRDNYRRDHVRSYPRDHRDGRDRGGDRSREGENWH